MVNRIKFTPENRAKVLECISKGMTMSASARAAGVDPHTVYEWRRDNEEFREAFEQAYKLGGDALEDVALERAFGGSDSLLMFLLRARDPHKWNRKVIGVGQDEDAQPVNVNVAMIYPRKEDK